MLALEHARRQQSFDQFLDFETNLHNSYPPYGMNAYGMLDFASSYAANIPLSFSDNPTLFVEAPQEQFQHDMSRSDSSTGALTYSHHSHLSTDLPPSSLSSASGPSIPSAPSSTVGSPYSGHSNIISIQDSWTGSHQGLGLDPAIVSHESFPHEYVGASLDSDLSFNPHDKVTGNFVGEYADLSYSQERSSTLPTAISQTSQSLPSHTSLNASPEQLTIDAILDRAKSLNSGAQQSQETRSSPSPGLPAGQPIDSRQRSESTFKPPTTPASARTRTATPGPSAVLSRSVSAPTPMPTTSPFNPHAHVQPPLAQHVNHFQNHFFAQSSGNFMAPLESSYPSLIQAPRTSYTDVPATYAEQNLFPTMSQSYHISPTASPAPSPQNFQTYPMAQLSPANPFSNFNQQAVYTDRRGSIASFQSGQSHASPMSSGDFDDDYKEKGRCPNPECGRVFKDLKAHMLTHQSERPEKCPILNCEYNQKGFARKYDKNRHTLTHYKGTMVCGFCPGSGSAAEKSFNRADVFKRHLTSMHGVEQTAPNSRKRSPVGTARKLTSYCQDATGKCSTCSATFNNAQDFYEHLDDCVLRVVQQEEPSEAINQIHLTDISADDSVKETMERNMIRTEESMTTEDDFDEDDEEEDEDEMTFNNRGSRGLVKANKSRAILSGGVSKPGRPAKKGLTYSKGGVPLKGGSRKNRKNYPPSWGMSAEKMQTKKRVLCVYDGERRLWKDDIMMRNEFEVRMKLADGKSYVTDLDMETLKRAQAFHHATEEEKGPWVPEPVDLEELMA